MSSRADSSLRTSSDVTFKPVGIGMSMRFMRRACNKPSPQLGSGMRMVLGMRAKVCVKCKKPEAK